MFTVRLRIMTSALKPDNQFHHTHWEYFLLFFAAVLYKRRRRKDQPYDVGGGFLPASLTGRGSWYMKVDDEL
jgi:hypothetical protein